MSLRVRGPRIAAAGTAAPAPQAGSPQQLRAGPSSLCRQPSTRLWSMLKSGATQVQHVIASLAKLRSIKGVAFT